MVIKFTSQTIAFDSEIMYIGKIVYVKKSSKSYKFKVKPRFTPQMMALPKKLALVMLVVYLLHFFTDIKLYLLGDMLWAALILLTLLWDREQRIKQKASLESEIKTAYFLEIHAENGTQVYFGSEQEKDISELFVFLSHLYDGEVKGSFESNYIIHLLSLDGPTLFPKEYELMLPPPPKNPKKSLEEELNDSIEKFTEIVASALEEERYRLRTFSYKAFLRERKKDWELLKEKLKI